MKEAYTEEPDGGNPLDTEKGSAADRVRLFYELYLPEVHESQLVDSDTLVKYPRGQFLHLPRPAPKYFN